LTLNCGGPIDLPLLGLQSIRVGEIPITCATACQPTSSKMKHRRCKPGCGSNPVEIHRIVGQIQLVTSVVAKLGVSVIA
jgi:hypothetical protein